MSKQLSEYKPIRAFLRQIRVLLNKLKNHDKPANGGGKTASTVVPIGLPDDYELTKIGLSKAEEHKLVEKKTDDDHKNELADRILLLYTLNFYSFWLIVAFQALGPIFNLPVLNNTQFGTIAAASSITNITQIVFKYYFNPDKKTKNTTKKRPRSGKRPPKKTVIK